VERVDRWDISLYRHCVSVKLLCRQAHDNCKFSAGHMVVNHTSFVKFSRPPPLQTSALLLTHVADQWLALFL
jgi:hypothetical protein